MRIRSRTGQLAPAIMAVAAVIAIGTYGIQGIAYGLRKAGHAIVHVINHGANPQPSIPETK